MAPEAAEVLEGMIEEIFTRTDTYTGQPVVITQGWFGAANETTIWTPPITAQTGGTLAAAHPWWTRRRRDEHPGQKIKWRGTSPAMMWALVFDQPKYLQYSSLAPTHAGHPTALSWGVRAS